VLASARPAGVGCGLQGGGEWEQVLVGVAEAAAILSQGLPPRQGG